MYLPGKYTVLVCLISITLGVCFYYLSDRELTEKRTIQMESVKRVVVQISEYTYTKNTEQLMSGYNFISKNLLDLDVLPTKNINEEKHTEAVTSAQAENPGVFNKILMRCLLLVLLLMTGIFLHRVDLYSEFKKLLESSTLAMVVMKHQTLSIKKRTIFVGLGLFIMLLTTGQLLFYLSILSLLSAVVLIVEAIQRCFTKDAKLNKIPDFERCNVIVFNTTATSFIAILIMEFLLVCVTGFVIFLAGWYLFCFGKQKEDPNDLEKRFHDTLDFKDVLKIHAGSNKDELFRSTLMFVQKLFFLNSDDNLFKLEHNSECTNPADTTGFAFMRNLPIIKQIINVKLLLCKRLCNIQYNSQYINPTDTTFLAFIRSTPMLRKIITAKLLLHKLAIPFAFPASKNAKIKILYCPSLCTDSKADTADCTYDVVSFLRVGFLSVSKSKLINYMLDNDHETFLSVTNSNFKSTRKYSEGLIEAAWFEPSGSMETNRFDNVTMILNLRGDGEHEIDQSNLLLQMSSVNVVMITLSNMRKKGIKLFDKIRNQQNVAVLLLIQNDCNIDHLQVENIVEENFKGIEIFSFVILGTQEKELEEISSKIRDLLLLAKPGIKTSIKERIEKLGTVDIDEIGTVIKETKDSANLIFKNMFGSKKHRHLPLQGEAWKKWTDLYKNLCKTAGSNLDDYDKKRNDMKMLRQEQPKMILQNIENLMSYLKSCKHDELFVLWFKNFLNDGGQKDAPDLITFNHMCREMGLTYESLHGYEGEGNEHKSIADLLKQLAVTSAEIVLRGQTFEILDGDVGNIPMTWVNAVFLELTKIMKKQKILVLSIVGNKRSKSELLYALFGCPFLLSDTRGVSMQLKQVADTKLPFDDILIIDIQSENMPSDIFHESVKLAVGLGDIVLVSIKTCCEVETVLQTTMQALQLVQKAYNPYELKKTCFCISHEDFQQEIDTFCAEHKNMTDGLMNILRFSSFNEGVIDLKKAVFKSFDQRNPCMLIHDVGNRVDDLWTGLLKGDDGFIIHFKDKLEKRAYTRLEKQYQTKIWELEKHTLDFVARKTRRCAKWSETTTTDKISEITLELQVEICDQENKIKDELESFIQNNVLCVVMLPLKAIFLAKLQNVSVNFKNDAVVKKSIESIQQEEKNENNMNAQLLQLANSAKTGTILQDEELTTKFENEFWTEWVKNCTFKYDKSTIMHLFKCLVRFEDGDDVTAAYFRSGISRTILFHVSNVLQSDAKLKESMLKDFAYSKFKLIKDIMTDLANKEVFEEYKEYINVPDTFAKKWLTEKVNEKGSDISVVVNKIVNQMSTILESITINDLDNIQTGTLILIDRFVMHVNKSDLKMLRNLYISKDYFTRMEDRNISSVEKLRKLLIAQLKEFKKEFKRDTAWTNTIVAGIMDVLWGCKEKCMFCNEPCKHTDKGHLETFTTDQKKLCHSCIQHRPIGIGGWGYEARENSRHLNPNFCNRLLKTEETYTIPKSTDGQCRPFSEYKTDYDDWEIVSSEYESKYWIWVLVKYEADLAKMHECDKPKTIPENWKTVSKLEALESLSVMH